MSKLCQKLLLQGTKVVAQLLPLFRFLQAAMHHASRPPPPEASPTSPPSTAPPANSADPLAMILAGCFIPAAEASSQAGANAATAAAAPAVAGAGAQAAPAAAEVPPATASSDGSGLEEDMEEDEDMEEEVEIEDDAGERRHLWYSLCLLAVAICSLLSICRFIMRVCVFTASTDASKCLARTSKAA